MSRKIAPRLQHFVACPSANGWRPFADSPIAGPRLLVAAAELRALLAVARAARTFDNCFACPEDYTSDEAEALGRALARLDKVSR